MKSCSSEWLTYLLLQLRPLPVLSAPFQWCFICSLMIIKDSHCQFCSPGDQILTVLTYLQRSLLCIHSTKLSTCPRSALPLHVWGTGWLSPPETWFTAALCTAAAEETGFFWDLKCNPGKQVQLWMGRQEQPSFALLLSPSSRGRRESNLTSSYSSMSPSSA